MPPSVPIAGELGDHLLPVPVSPVTPWPPCHLLATERHRPSAPPACRRPQPPVPVSPSLCVPECVPPFSSSASSPMATQASRLCRCRHPPYPPPSSQACRFFSLCVPLPLLTATIQCSCRSKSAAPSAMAAVLQSSCQSRSPCRAAEPCRISSAPCRPLQCRAILFLSVPSPSVSAVPSQVPICFEVRAIQSLYQDSCQEIKSSHICFDIRAESKPPCQVDPSQIKLKSCLSSSSG